MFLELTRITFLGKEIEKIDYSRVDQLGFFEGSSCDVLGIHWEREAVNEFSIFLLNFSSWQELRF